MNTRMTGSSRHSREGGNPVNKQIIEEASSWFVDFRVGDIDARRRKEFHDWLRRSPEHIQAYLDIAMTYAELPAPGPKDEIDVLALVDSARWSPDANVVAIPGQSLEASGPNENDQELESRNAGLNNRVLAIAACIVMMIALGGWFYFERETYSTEIGEQRSLVLADGSTVELNSRSRIRVRYSDHERHIELVDGQALFEVAKNKLRPFVVHVGDTQVRAVGTQFDVYRRRTGTIVTVVEGKVSVDLVGSAETSAPPPTLEATPIVVTGGEQLTVSHNIVAKPRPVNPNSATAWTRRQLIFDNASLGEVAEEFNRYSTRPIIVESRALDTFHVSGTYSLSNPESLLRFLRVQPGIKLIETDREIRIDRE
jgi:transmembrane sensor